MSKETVKETANGTENKANKDVKENNKNNSQNLKIIWGGVLGGVLISLLWIFGVFDGGSSKGKGVDKGVHVHSDVTEHRLQGSTVYATAYVGYGVNAEYCAKNVLNVAHSLMTNKYKNASSLVLKYGIDYTNKYGEKKKKLIGTFKPNMSELRRYKSSHDYSYGELGDGAMIMMEFQYAGFR